MYVKSFKDLDVYKLSRELAKEIYQKSQLFPVSERYSLTDQVRRSSRSVGAQIAEAWGKRRYEKHFIKLTDADGEQLETDPPVHRPTDYRPTEHRSTDYQAHFFPCALRPVLPALCSPLPARFPIHRKIS